jgi:trigger factor
LLAGNSMYLGFVPRLYVKKYMELVQRKEGLITTLTVKVSQADYAAKVEKELKKLRQTSQIKGFRPGYAPMPMIKRLYWQSVLLDEINKLLAEAVLNYEQENIDRLVTHVIPVNNNHLNNIESQTDFEFYYHACFFPELTIQLSELELPYYNIIVADKEIDDEIDRLRNVCAKSEDADEVEDNCYLKVAIRLTKDGEEKTLYKDLRVSDILDEFRSAITGAKMDDEINVEIRKIFDNEYRLFELLEIDQTELDSLPETLPFVILEIYKQVLPEIDQDFFDMVAEENIVHSEEELREYVRNNIVTEYKKISRSRLYGDSIEVLKEKADITLPENYIVRYLNFAHKNEGEDMPGEDESTVRNFTEDAIWNYIVNSLLSQAGIKITAENIQANAKEVIFDYYGKISDSHADSIFQYCMSSEDNSKYIIDQIKNRKFASLLKDTVKLNTIDISFDDFCKLYGTKTEQ